MWSCFSRFDTTLELRKTNKDNWKRQDGFIDNETNKQTKRNKINTKITSDADHVFLRGNCLVS